jgi:hypothetical protein
MEHESLGKDEGDYGHPHPLQNGWDALMKNAATAAAESDKSQPKAVEPKR